MKKNLSYIDSVHRDGRIWNIGVMILLMKKPKFAWLGDYALPDSLILGMASAIPITAWLG